MEYIVCKQHIFRDELGRPLPKMPGDHVNVDRRSTAIKLREQGIIMVEETALNMKRPLMKPASWKGIRIGVFMHTSKFYSGGRIHVYQIAWTLANAGAEVFLITDNLPRWRDDYPLLDNLHIISDGSTRYTAPPLDIDVIFTDGKSAPGANAIRYKENHPLVPLICLNFETPNWMADFDKNIAKKMPHLEHIFKHADILLANSNESLKFLREFMTVDKPTGVIPPAANTAAVDTNTPTPLPPEFSGVPYVVWSARSSAYKGAHVIVKAVQEYPKPLNLVMVGKPSFVPPSNKLHKYVKFDVPVTDAEKMELMKGAAAVAAPSLFEGFGMVPSEALINGTPVVAYDLPVLRQEYGNSIIYAKHNNPSDFAAKLYETIENRPEVDKDAARKKFGLPAMQKYTEKVPYFNFNKRTVSAHMICYYGKSVQQALASVYENVDEILIAHGPTKLWQGIQPDNSLQLIQDFPDPENKIKLEARSSWENKGKMREWTTSYATGSHFLVVDADEIYHNLEAWVKDAPDWGCPRWVHFWHDLAHYVTDSSGMARWGAPHELGGCIHNHFRWGYWRYSNTWNDRGTTPIGADSGRMVNMTNEAVAKLPETCIYHLGHVMNRDLMRAKHEFYLRRDGRDAGRKKRMQAWHTWVDKLGDCGDGLIKPVNWELPPLVVQAYEEITGKELCDVDTNTETT